MYMESAGSGSSAIRSMSAIVGTAAALVLLVSCNDGGDSGPLPLQCDATLAAEFRPDANTSVLLVRSFKKGEPLVLAFFALTQVAQLL